MRPVLRGRNERVVRYYATHSLRQCAKRFGLTFQRIHQIILEEAPKKMRERGRPLR